MKPPQQNPKTWHKIISVPQIHVFLSQYTPKACGYASSSDIPSILCIWEWSGSALGQGTLNFGDRASLAQTITSALVARQMTILVVQAVELMDSPTT